MSVGLSAATDAGAGPSQVARAGRDVVSIGFSGAPFERGSGAPDDTDGPPAPDRPRLAGVRVRVLRRREPGGRVALAAVGGRHVLGAGAPVGVAVDGDRREVLRRVERL